MQKGKNNKKHKEHDETKGKPVAENKLENEAKKKRQHCLFQNAHSNFWEILSPGSEDADESMLDCNSESEKEMEEPTPTSKTAPVPQMAPWGTSEGFKLNNAESELRNNMRKEIGLDVKLEVD
eukprot:1142141-Rhodomonas_salina.1